MKNCIVLTIALSLSMMRISVAQLMHINAQPVALRNVDRLKNSFIEILAVSYIFAVDENCNFRVSTNNLLHFENGTKLV